MSREHIHVCCCFFFDLAFFVIALQKAGMGPGNHVSQGFPRWLCCQWIQVVTDTLRNPGLKPGDMALWFSFLWISDLIALVFTFLFCEMDQMRLLDLHYQIVSGSLFQRNDCAP